MTLSIALFLALIMAAVVLALRWTGQQGSREPDPERLLAARFANGKIDADEPPLSVVGDLGDAALGHRVAEACVRRFVLDVAGRLEQEWVRT